MRALFLALLVLAAGAFYSAPAQAAMPERYAEAPGHGFADDGGTGFHGLKTMDIPMEQSAMPAEEPAAATEGAEGGEHKKGLPQFDPSSFPSQIFWLAVSFLIMYVAFSQKTLPDIGKVLQKRQAHIESNLSKAQRLRESAEKARERYEASVAEAQEKSTQLFAKAHDEVKAKTAAGLEEFRNRANLQIQDTEDYIAKAKKEAMESIHSVAAEIAAIAAQKIVGVSTDIDQAKTVVKNLNKKAA